MWLGRCGGALVKHTNDARRGWREISLERGGLHAGPGSVKREVYKVFWAPASS